MLNAFALETQCNGNAENAEFFHFDKGPTSPNESHTNNTSFTETEMPSVIQVQSPEGLTSSL